MFAFLLLNNGNHPRTKPQIEAWLEKAGVKDKGITKYLNVKKKGLFSKRGRGRHGAYYSVNPANTFSVFGRGVLGARTATSIKTMLRNG